MISKFVEILGMIQSRVIGAASWANVGDSLTFCNRSRILSKAFPTLLLHYSFPRVQVQTRRCWPTRLKWETRWRKEEEVQVVEDGNGRSAANGGGAPFLLQLWRAVAQELGSGGYAWQQWTAVLGWAKSRGPTEQTEL